MQQNAMGGQISISGQYIKSLNFNSPQVPQIFTEANISPKIDVAIDINATKIQTNTYEVAVTIECTSQYKEENVFMVQLIYAGIFVIENIPDSLIEEALFIYCPHIIFPFMRRIISDVTRDANFSPLMLEPINFEELYNSRKDTIKKTEQ